MDSDHFTTDLRPEDFRHAWPAALRQMLELHAASLDRTEAALAEATRIGEEMKATIASNARIAAMLGHALKHIAQSPDGLLAQLKTTTDEHVENNVRVLQSQFHSLAVEIRRQLKEQAVESARVIDQAATEARRNAELLALDHTDNLAAIGAQVQAQCQSLQHEQQRLAAHMAAFQKIRTDKWWRRLLWVALGEQMPAPRKGKA